MHEREFCERGWVLEVGRQIIRYPKLLKAIVGKYTLIPFVPYFEPRKYGHVSLVDVAFGVLESIQQHARASTARPQLAEQILGKQALFEETES